MLSAFSMLVAAMLERSLDLSQVFTCFIERAMVLCIYLYANERATGMERSRDWMEQAQNDLEHARNDMEDGFHNWACFSAQQSAEKAVKAVFQKMGAVAWGHSVADLLQELSQSHRLPEGLHDAALELDKAYIPTRYPDAHPSGSPHSRYTKQEAGRLIVYAQKIIEFCAGLLS